MEIERLLKILDVDDYRVLKPDCEGEIRVKISDERLVGLFSREYYLRQVAGIRALKRARVENPELTEAEFLRNCVPEDEVLRAFETIALEDELVAASGLDEREGSALHAATRPEQPSLALSPPPRHHSGGGYAPDAPEKAERFLRDLVGSDDVAELKRLLAARNNFEIGLLNVVRRALTAKGFEAPYHYQLMSALIVVRFGLRRGMQGREYGWTKDSVFVGWLEVPPGKSARHFDDTLAREKFGITREIAFIPYNPDVTPFKRRHPPRSQGIKSVKWVPWWAHVLGREFARELLRGLRFADGKEQDNLNVIGTSSARERDEIVQVALHGGYSPYFVIHSLAGSESWIPKYSKDESVKAVRNHDHWHVRYADSEVENAVKCTEPCVEIGVDTVKTYDDEGLVWSVKMPYDFIIARRAFKNANGVVTKASRPLIFPAAT